MDLPSQEVEIPMPLNAAYGGALVHGHVTNMIHHHHHQQQHDHDDNAHDHPSPPPSQFQAPSTNGPPMPMAQNHDLHHQHLHHIKKHQQQVRYKECLKNHAASMGGSATDGCGEFMPSGEEGSIESLTCSACNCHRNFHRKEVEGEISSFPVPQLMYGSNQQQHLMINSRGRKVINLGHHKNMLYTGNGGGGPRSVPMIPYNMGSLMISSDQSDDQEELGGAGVAASGGVACRALPPPPPPPSAQNQNQYYIHHHNQMLKKRFRTKFTPEQKEKMLSFAEKVGWKIQKQEESVVNEFCQEIGVKRRVLKVWMHNNKHSLAKKSSDISNA